jgi:hypothetical protein
MELTLVILAAGMGSRYGGLKQTEAFGPSGETLMDYSLFDGLRAGFNKVVFVIREDFAPAFKASIEPRLAGKIAVDYVYQKLEDLPPGFSVPAGRNKPWGTAHALLCARKKVSGPMVVLNADDYYGPEAYRLSAEFLGTPCKSAKCEWALIGYTLRDTLSPHGHVSRGICQVDDAGFLTSIEEHTKITRSGSRAVSELPNGSRELAGDEPVSMNFWAFHPDIFPAMEKTFGSFIKEHGNDPKAECFLPLAVGEEVREETARVRVLRTTGQWFGVTYQEERPQVQASIREMISAGKYPEKLW